MAPRGTKRKAADSVEAKGPIEHPSLQTTPGDVFVVGSGDYGQLGLGEDVTEKFRPGPLGINGEKARHGAASPLLPPPSESTIPLLSQRPESYAFLAPD